ncbi:hypothetical protein HanXRQr2_Chr04g0175371 [Helianthus annuus]|uniref:Uncharacterized protein n=1 Tax=Helianthus annuus TaxID=4232 RepID=A0A9K3JAM5_HELAN|nr:hypothetical protein HanXRQr2_Chr04g0175371 [Helianthus annuus]KAJ0932048.1 hypothetical protein HanPSC8_Chr04g0169101 [Helianthus annuus]
MPSLRQLYTTMRKHENTHTIQTRRLHQIRRETHTLVKDSQSVTSIFMKLYIKLGVTSLS